MWRTREHPPGGSLHQGPWRDSTRCLGRWLGARRTHPTQTGRAHGSALQEQGQLREQTAQLANCAINKEPRSDLYCAPQRSTTTLLVTWRARGGRRCAHTATRARREAGAPSSPQMVGTALSLHGKKTKRASDAKLRRTPPKAARRAICTSRQTVSKCGRPTHRHTPAIHRHTMLAVAPGYRAGRKARRAGLRCGFDCAAGAAGSQTHGRMQRDQLPAPCDAPQPKAVHHWELLATTERHWGGRDAAGTSGGRRARTQSASGPRATPESGGHEQRPRYVLRRNRECQWDDAGA